ncbi:MAG: hypothetical protein ACE5KH_04745 [Candidatus Geothermarchaeales archaeon]
MNFGQVLGHLEFTRAKVALLSVLAVLYLVSFVAHQMQAFAILGYALGSVLIYVSSGGLIKALKNFAYYSGLSEYATGVVSGFASGVPEAVVVILLVASGVPALLETAVTAVVLTAGFNLLLIGVYILLAGFRSHGVIRVPKEVIERESDLLRISIVMAGLIFALGLTRGIGSFLPWEVGGFMLTAYFVYGVFLFRSGGGRRETPSELIPRGETYVLLALGFLIVLIAAESIRESTVLVVEFFHLAPVAAATLVALVGSVPEHGVAIMGGLKGEHSIGLANLLSGVTQTFLITFGAIILLAPVTVNGFLLFQLASLAGVVWLVKKSITDDERLTADEGLFILALQVLIFILIEELRF